MNGSRKSIFGSGPAIRCYSGTKANAQALTGVSAAIRRRFWAVVILLGGENTTFEKVDGYANVQYYQIVIGKKNLLHQNLSNQKNHFPILPIK